MTTKLPVPALLLLLLGLVLAAARPALAAKQLYTCSMHPQVITEEPGDCPICGMKLVPIPQAPAAGASSSGASSPAADGPGPVIVDTATLQRMNLRTAPVESGPVRRDIRSVGTIAFDERGLRDITTKVDGWLETVAANATWATVRAGDPLFTLYSPDLVNAQLNYALALRTEGPAGGPLTRAALARLQALDVPAATIAALDAGQPAAHAITVRAPADGTIIERMATQGQMIRAGDRLYRLADLGTVWVHAQVTEDDLPFVKPGQAVTIRTTYGPAAPREGVIALLLPQVDETTRSATARIVLANADGQLRPGMFVDVRLEARLAENATLVPAMAVLRSGEHDTVFVALDGGRFEPREVRLGARSEGGFYQVLDGLRPGERIVTSGQFMLDSESQLQEAIGKMTRQATQASAATPPPAPSSSTAAAAQALPLSSVAAAAPVTAPAAYTAPADSATTLRPLALAAADAATALAGENLAAYLRVLPSLRAAVAAHAAADKAAGAGPLAPFLGGPADPADLQAAHHDFQAFSTAVSNLVLRADLARVERLHVFECPMVRARWIQRDPGTHNPFLGNSMADCGSEITAP